MLTKHPREIRRHPGRKLIGPKLGGIGRATSVALFATPKMAQMLLGDEVDVTAIGEVDLATMSSHKMGIRPEIAANGYRWVKRLPADNVPILFSLPFATP